MTYSNRVLLAVVLLAVFSFLAGCQDATKTDIPSDSADHATANHNPNSVNPDLTDATVQGTQPGNGGLDSDEIEPSGVEKDRSDSSGDSSTMKKCVSDMDSVKTTYYIAKNKIYSKTETSNGGKIIRIADSKEICLWLNEEQKWNCVPNTKDDFASELSSTNEQVSEEMGAIMNFKCEIVDYDKNLFNTDNRLQ